MISSRNEYGHYVPKKNIIQLSEHIEPEPKCSGRSGQIDPIILFDAKSELNDYIRHLRNDYELSGSLEFF